MIMFILSNDFLIGFISWDLLGITSYLLINYWISKVNSGIKAIVYNKVGDIGFMIGIVLLYDCVGWFGGVVWCGVFGVVCCGGVLCGVFGCVGLFGCVCLLVIMFSKSAQLPFSGWLLNAMSAPTPVSALLHSSTMVIAGVYLGLLNDFVWLGLVCFGWVWCGLFLLLVMLTLIWSSWNAVSVSDVKSIIAFSTISQISYMFLALLVGPVFSMFHILVHAVFKSLLFILCGGLIHTQFNQQSIYRMKINNSIMNVSYIQLSSILILSISKRE